MFPVVIIKALVLKITNEINTYLLFALYVIPTYSDTGSSSFIHYILSGNFYNDIV